MQIGTSCCRIFFIVLTLTIGLATVNSQLSPSNDAYALDDKFINKLKEFCPSIDFESSNMKDKLSDIIMDCSPVDLLPYPGHLSQIETCGNPDPRDNPYKCPLQVYTYIAINDCGACPPASNMHVDIRSDYAPPVFDHHVYPCEQATATGNCSAFRTFYMPAWQGLTITTSVDNPRWGDYVFELANIKSTFAGPGCNGVDSCRGVIKGGIGNYNYVEIWFHWKNLG
jgi:hypothetical protein